MLHSCLKVDLLEGVFDTKKQKQRDTRKLREMMDLSTYQIVHIKYVQSLVCLYLHKDVTK